MKYKQLLLESRRFLISQGSNQPAVGRNFFSNGARWMYHQLNELEPMNKKPFPVTVNFSMYGLLKYSVSLFSFAVSAVFFSHIHFTLVPLAVLLFYLAEVQFLFLFPLLLDKVRHPVRSSVKATWRIGIFAAITTTIPIAFYMIAGLRHKQNPFRQWYIGCMAIIIWYVQEIRNRV